jgi:hypothetical protein
MVSFKFNISKGNLTPWHILGMRREFSLPPLLPVQLWGSTGIPSKGYKGLALE